MCALLCAILNASEHAGHKKKTTLYQIKVFDSIYRI